MHLSLRLGARASSRCQARAIMYDAQDRYRGDSRPGSRGYHRPSAGAAEAEAMPARTDRAINTDAIVFMARTPYPRSDQHPLSTVIAWRELAQRANAASAANHS